MSLIKAGAVLFLFGLLQGAAVQGFSNPRMALSAHLTAVQSGMALMIVGAIWTTVSLGPGLAKFAQLTVTFGMFFLWLGLTLAAATGASAVVPIAGAGFRAGRVEEMMVSVAVLGGSGLMTVGWLLLVVGLVRTRQP